jgi:hypothetical protein
MRKKRDKSFSQSSVEKTIFSELGLSCLVLACAFWRKMMKQQIDCFSNVSLGFTE